MKSPEHIVTLYMKALDNASLSESVWKKLAKVNQIVLDMSHDFEPTDAEKEMLSIVQSAPAPHTNYERVCSNKDDLKIIVELLADIEHERWANWQSYLHSKLYEINDNRVSLNHHLKILPTELYDRWERQIKTPYSQLSEPEKESDKKEVYKTLRALVSMGYKIYKDTPQTPGAKQGL